MSLEKPRITAKIAGRPLHPLLRPFAIGYFLAVCACDLVYSQSNVFVRDSAPEIASITEWLLVVGLIMAGLAAIVAVIDLWASNASAASRTAMVASDRNSPIGVMASASDEWRMPRL